MGRELGRSEQFLWIKILSTNRKIFELYTPSDEKLHWRGWKGGVSMATVKVYFMPFRSSSSGGFGLGLGGGLLLGYSMGRLSSGGYGGYGYGHNYGQYNRAGGYSTER